MDDSIFVDLVNALLNYEKEDKEHTKKGKEPLKEKDNQKENEKKDETKTETRIEKTESGKTAVTLFPSMHIFNVRKLNRQYVNRQYISIIL